MNVTPEHVEEIRAGIVPLDTPQRRARYIAGDFHNADKVKDLNKRYRWDLYWLSRMNQGGLDYKDSHIDTALRSIVPKLELELQA